MPDSSEHDPLDFVQLAAVSQVLSDAGCSESVTHDEGADASGCNSPPDHPENVSLPHRMIGELSAEARH